MNIDFKNKADKYISKIYKKEVYPKRFVDFSEDKNFYLNTKTYETEKREIFNSGDKICLDFGRHITGYFEFSLEEYDRYIDAPVRIKIKFGETPYEMRRSFSDYNAGLCSSWLQEEIITVDLKGRVRLPRRYAFRFVEITVLATRPTVVLRDFVAHSETSADYSALAPIETSKELERIDRVSVETLSECMQDFFEDGPKRDRRLWLGDFRIQALADYYTFGNIDLIKRCLYLFAAFENDERVLPSCVYVKPDLEDSGSYLVTYALLFAVTLCDYYEHTKDKEVTEELYEVAKKQIEITKTMLDENKIITMPEDYGWWSFVDWAELEGITATMGIYIYTVKRFKELSKALGKADDEKKYTAFSKELEEASLKHLYNGGVFKNEYDKGQLSVHSQVWMILAGVVSKEDARRILNECIGNEAYLSPKTPYMHHYVVEALMEVGMEDRAREYIIDYWGAMIDCGADTFWEAFDKNDPYLSPYDDVIMNSACHAWSCTPTYFIRKYGMK